MLNLHIVLRLFPFVVLAACHAPSNAPVRHSGISVEDLLAVRAPGSPTLAPDGTLYVRDWPDGINQLYRMGTGGATALKLTAFNDGLASYSLAPDGRNLVLAAATGGNEQNQLYLLDAAREGTHAIEPLLTHATAQFRLNTWLADGSGFFYTANDVSPSDFHVYRYDLATHKATKVSAREGSWSASDATRDGARVALGRYVSESDARVYELTTSSSDLRGFQPDAAESTKTEAVGYLADERALVCTSDIEGGTSRVWLWTPATGERRRPLPDLDRFEVDSANVNPERTLLAVVTNEDGYGALHVYRLPNFEPVPLPTIGRGVVSVADLRGNTLVWSLANARNPGLSYRYQVPASGVGRAETITSADTRGLDLATFVEPELVHYRSFDGREIPAFLYVPKDRAPGTRIPFVVNYHGGPEGQFRPGFDRTVQILVARGMGVLQPNVRGSTGYGREFHRLDDYKKRWDSVKDGVEAARWLVREGYATEGKIATFGGSYGGFMSVATLVEGGALFGAGVDVVGIVNMQTFLEKTSGYRRKLREAEYGPLEDSAFLKSVSPLFRASEIRVPMMIAHGLNDPRVPVGEAMQLAEELQRRGDNPELLFFHDEGHGFQKLDNRVLFTNRLVAFLERTIGAP